jgi:hypothetical protein
MKPCKAGNLYTALQIMILLYKLICSLVSTKKKKKKKNYTTKLPIKHFRNQKNQIDY